ncbi:MAG: class I SAM-dependent methyltransferase, partial [Anaerolineae bacterium]|nr:class I SAM-dependent methyltransferase [Anaerolineae bacterium]
MIPQLYDLHHSNYIEDLDYWTAWARKRYGAVLELGCGTGRTLLPLARAGFHVTGLDFDADMIAFLQGRLGQEGIGNISLVQADMRSFDLGEQFSLVISPCNTFSTLDGQGRLEALACVEKHLLPGGVFAASMPNPYLLASLEEFSEPELEISFDHPVSGNPVEVSSAWRKEEQVCVFIWHYDELLPDGFSKRISVETRHA